MTEQFDNNVPIPCRTAHKRYGLRAMQVGQSLFVPIEPGDYAERVRNRLIAAAVYVCKQNPAWKFTTERRTEDGVDGIRIWRIA